MCDRATIPQPWILSFQLPIVPILRWPPTPFFYPSLHAHSILNQRLHARSILNQRLHSRRCILSPSPHLKNPDSASDHHFIPSPSKSQRNSPQLKTKHPNNTMSNSFFPRLVNWAKLRITCRRCGVSFVCDSQGPRVCSNCGYEH
jgi:hypothetical protein